MSDPSYTVLVVEDDTGLRKTIKLALKKHNFQIFEASNGLEALDVFHKGGVDAMILDAVMPRMDGFEVCSRIRNGSEGNQLPIIMITGLDDPESFDRAFGVGVSEFITKPVNLSVLSHRTLRLIREIKERQRAEEERVKADKLEMMGILAGGIAHDLNNIMTALMSNLSLVRMELREEEKAFEYLHECQPVMEQAMQLAQQLLTFSRGGEPIKKLVDLTKIVKSSVQFAQRATQSVAIFNIPAGIWYAEIDEGQIVQVISNLVINADQAMPGGGTLEISLRNIQLEEENSFGLKEGAYVVIRISDQGVGIPERFIGRIFDPYFTTKKKGSGLGLATAYSVIDRHKGYIEVKSEMGEGACFSCYLPAQPDTRLASKPAERLLEGGQGRILCLEDQEIIRRGVTRLLEKECYTVTCTERGEETIVAYETAFNTPDRYNLVILDMPVPGGMGGLETIQRLKSIDPHVRAIVSSGYSDDPVMASPSEYGFKGVLPNPFSRDELLRVVSEVLSK